LSSQSITSIPHHRFKKIGSAYQEFVIVLYISAFIPSWEKKGQPFCIFGRSLKEGNKGYSGVW
jgi:hypothetical protein